jgi:hypothetical protein
MTLLSMIRRFHAPLACLAIACVVSAGCTSSRETVSLGEPKRIYKADNGSLLFGYDVRPAPRVTLDPMSEPDYAGWHWLIIEPDTAEVILRGAASDELPQGSRIVAVSYEGWGKNARLVPPLLEPGLPDNTPPVIGEGGLSPLLFASDSEMGGVRLLLTNGSTASIVQVSPGFQTQRVWSYNSELTRDILRVAAVAAVVTGLILLGGSGSISIN